MSETAIRALAVDWYLKRSKPSPIDANDFIEFGREVAALVAQEAREQVEQRVERLSRYRYVHMSGLHDWPTGNFLDRGEVLAAIRSDRREEPET